MSLFDSIGAGVSTGGKFVRDLPPDDEWIDVYIACDPEPATRTNFNTQEVEPCLSWKLKSVKLKRSDGEPFLFFLNTNTRFSPNNDKGHLTQIMDAVFGRRLTADEFRQIKPGELIGQCLRIQAKHYQGFDKYEQKNVTKYAVDTKGGFKACRTPLRPGVDFEVVKYTPKARVGDEGVGPTPPPVSYNARGNAVIQAPPKEKEPGDEWADLHDPFKEDEDKEVEL